MKPAAQRGYGPRTRAGSVYSSPHWIAYTIQDMDIPGLRLHPLKGKLKGRWSIWVSGNWRLTFEFKDGD